MESFLWKKVTFRLYYASCPHKVVKHLPLSNGVQYMRFPFVQKEASVLRPLNIARDSDEFNRFLGE